MKKRRRHDTQLVRQVGEHLVVSELGRLDIYATPFAGNVPDFDVLASDRFGHCLPLQVKTIRKGSWQFNVKRFLDIEQHGKTQVKKGKKPLAYPNLVCVFVLLKDRASGGAEFYIFPLSWLQRFCNRQTPKSQKREQPTSTHGAIRPKDLKQHLDKWGLITKHFKVDSGD